jgi:hypothetical protein
MRTVEINGVAYPFKYGYGATLYAEEVLEKSWDDVNRKTVKAQMVLFCGCFFNADSNFPYHWIELMQECDNDHTLYRRMNDELLSQLSRWGNPSEGEDDGKKKD